jgi:flagellar biosynthesis protein
MKKQSRSEVREQAVALRYRKQEESAPKVVAKGKGHVAQAIKEQARRYGIPIRRDDDLVALLAEVEIDREIPAELYAAVAELLAWIYKANEEAKIKEHNP